MARYVVAMHSLSIMGTMWPNPKHPAMFVSYSAKPGVDATRRSGIYSDYQLRTLQSDEALQEHNRKGCRINRKRYMQAATSLPSSYSPIPTISIRTRKKPMETQRVTNHDLRIEPTALGAWLAGGKGLLLTWTGEA